MTFADPVVLADGLDFPEGPAFDRSGRLWLVELKGGFITCHAGGKLRRFATGGAPNGLLVDGRGLIWFCDAGQNAIRTFDPGCGALATVCDQIDGSPLNKPNDLILDHGGNLIFTCPGDSRIEPTGYVCCLGRDGQLAKIKEGMFFPNGLALSPDGNSLFVAETYRQRIWRGRWEVNARQWLAPVPWAEDLGGAPGPDGLAFDDGLLFAAVYGAGQVKALDQDGAVSFCLDLPGRNPTNVAFDPQGKLGLVVTEAETGRLLSLRQVRP